MSKKYNVVTSISYPQKGAMGKTGNWRVFKPIFSKDKWIFCPDAAIKKNKDSSVSIDMNYCKGCGICANVCKVKAITMEREGQQ